MELKALILAILEDRPRHGYEIVQGARGKLRFEEGTIYPLLHKLERENLLSSQWKKASTGKERKYYTLTRRGKAALARARVAWKDYVRVVSEILLGGRRGAAGESAS